MKLLFLLLFIPVFVFGQIGVSQRLFTSVNDSIGSITSSDSVECQFYGGPWKLLTSSVNDTALITGDDKVAEQLVIFNLASESWWTYTNMMRFRIYHTAVDTITSGWVGTGGLNGSLTLFIQPDTIGTNTWFSKSWIEGR